MANTPRRSVRIPDETWNAALALANERGEKLSDIMRQALDQYTEKESEPMTSHAVTTFVRGTSDPQGLRKGYAASCTCGAITFGGFVSRTSARDALEHSEGEGE